MDSFCEQPRSVPVPIHVEKTVTSPHVPDVSLILQNRTQNKPTQFNEGCLSYNVWKARKEQNRYRGGYEREHDKENGSFAFKTNAQASFKKQVRFTGPVLQQNPSAANNPGHVLKPNGFEQIYIANMPNRHLDLSLVEPPKPRQNVPKQTEIVNPTTQSEFCYKREERVNRCSEFNASKFGRDSPDSDASVVKQINLTLPTAETRAYKQMLASYEDSFTSTRQSKPNNSSISRESSEKSRSEKQSGSDEPTVKDLLKIIQQQNEQMIILQKQVASLLENKNGRKQIESAPAVSQGSSPQFELPGKMFGKKLAIDVMTSFEVSIRQNFPHREMFLKDFNYEPRIQEITDGEEQQKNGDVLHGFRPETKQSNNTDDTLVLEESLKVQEESPSPEQSIHVDMQDYSSDSSSDDDSVNTGWTVYNNVMGQVNNMLKKKPNELQPTGKTKDETMQRVKEATLQHLKSLGVSLPTMSDSDRLSESSSRSEYTPSEVSFAVKQLLLKYLPDDQLAKIMRQPGNSPTNNCGDDAPKFVKRRPEFSFATLQYMKKYNLLNVNADAAEPPPAKPDVQQVGENPRILLDITALKQQPKLL